MSVKIQVEEDVQVITFVENESLEIHFRSNKRDEYGHFPVTYIIEICNEKGLPVIKCSDTNITVRPLDF